MFGRKLRRDLLLLGESKVTIDREALRATDEAQKDKAKANEDRKRQAKESKLCIGDTVVVLNPTRAKGEARFDPPPFTVKEINHGDFVIESKEGKIFKRNATHLKKLFDRPNRLENNSTKNSTLQNN